MKFVRKYAELIGVELYRRERFYSWRCPNKKCGMSILEEFICCPYCGQKIKFKEVPGRGQLKGRTSQCM